MKKAALRKWILTTAGVIALGLGVLGIILPLLPTTPFLLLAATCFFNSSEKLYTWLIGHKWFGDYIRHYREHRAVTLRVKIAALAVLWGAIGYTALGVVTAWWLRALLGAIAVGVSLHVLRLKTLTQEMIAGSKATSDTE